MPNSSSSATAAVPSPPVGAMRPTHSSSAAPAPMLSMLDVMALIVGIVIGAGIFSAPAMVAGAAGSVEAMLLAWVIGGVISVAGALCYAELATTYPNAGGDYHYLRMAFGEKVSFLFAWARLTVIPTGSIALLGYIFGDYSSQIYSFGPGSAAIYAVVMIVALTALNLIGLRSGKRVQNLLTLIEVAGVLFIIGAGLFLTPGTAPVTAAATQTGSAPQWGLVLVFVMLTYGGWNEAAYVSAETVGPKRNLPRALFWSLALITVFYLLVNIAYVKVLGLAGMAESKAVAADVLRAVMGPTGAQIISALIAVSAITSANATILTAARTTYAFGRDEPMFSFLGRWNARHHAPTNAFLVQGAIALALVGMGALTRSGFKTMVEYTAPVFWLFFLLTGISLFVLRRRNADRDRPFSVPLYPLTPLLFCATSAWLLYSSVQYTGIGALVGIAVLAVGAVLLCLRRPPARPAP